MKNDSLKFLTSLLLSFIILVVTGFLVRSNSRINDIWITHIVYLIAVYVSIRLIKIKPKTVLIAYIIGFAVPLILVMILGEMPLVFILNGFSFFLAVWSGYKIATSTTILVKSAFVLMSIAYCFIAVVYLSERLLHYDNFKNFEGETTEQLNVYGTISMGRDTLQLNSSDKIILLDFWTTNCGVCFQKFPKLETLYNKYKNDNRVAIYSVNVPISRDTAFQAEEMIRKQNYTFPVYLSYSGIDTQLNVRQYPTAILVSNNRIIGRGSIENISKILKDELK